MSSLRQALVPLLVALAALAVFEVRIRGEMVDFGVYRQAAARAVRAEPLYQPGDGHYQFKYLPAFAFAMAPFVAVSADAANAVWYAISVVLLLMLARWSIRLLPERRLGFGVLLPIVLILMAKFYGHELVLGQANGLFGILLLVALGAIDLDSPVVAGVLVGLALFVKPYGILFAPWLLVSAGRRAIAAFAVTAAIGLLAPALVYGWGGNLAQLHDWYHTVTATTAPNLVDADNISFAGMWAKWIGAGRPAVLFAGGTSLAALASAVWLWTRRETVPSPSYLEAAQLLLFVPLISPQGWDYVLLLGTPAAVVLIDRWRDVRPAWRILTGASLALMGLSFFDVMGRAFYGRFMAASIVTLCAIALAASLVNLRIARLA